MGHADGSDIHVAVTCACNLFQQWQSEVLLNSALRVGFRGPITRIVVGCEKKVNKLERVSHHQRGVLDNLVSLKEWQQTTYPNAFLHMVPHHSQKKSMTWFNKPWGFWHFSFYGTLRANVIAIVDPDQFFLAPLTQNVRLRADYELNHAWRNDPAGPTAMSWLGLPDPLPTDMAAPGMAIAQDYSIGANWIRKFNRTKVCIGVVRRVCGYEDWI